MLDSLSKKEILEQLQQGVDFIPMFEHDRYYTEKDYYTEPDPKVEERFKQLENRLKCSSP